MSLEDAVRKSDNLVVIDISVTPNSKTISVPDNYNQWRNRIEVKLTQKVEDGKANNQLIENFSEFFGVNKSNIKITNGEKSSQKSVSIKGLSYDDAVSILKSGLNDL